MRPNVAYLSKMIFSQRGLVLMSFYFLKICLVGREAIHTYFFTRRIKFPEHANEKGEGMVVVWVVFCSVK